MPTDFATSAPAFAIPYGTVFTIALAMVVAMFPGRALFEAYKFSLQVQVLWIELRRTWMLWCLYRRLLRDFKALGLPAPSFGQFFLATERVEVEQ